MTMGTVHAKDSQVAENENAKANAQTTPESCDENITKKIDLAGIKARVDKISVEGLQRTKDDIVIETVRDLFQANDFQQVIINAHKVKGKLENLGCFQNIGIFIDTSSGAGATLNGLEVTFFVKELKRMIGGISTMVGNNEGSLVVGLKAPNLFGRGEKVQAEYSYGSRRTNNLSLSFTKPVRKSFLRTRDALFTASIFQHGSDWPWSGYRLIERGLLLDLGFNSYCSWRHNFQYEGLWREQGTSSRSSAFDVREESGHKIKSAVRHILSVDKRDALIFPTRGVLFRFATEFAGIGGDISFFRNDCYLQWNFPLVSDLVLQATLQGGHVMKIGDDDLALPDKFYVGGPMSVRGFETRGVGPHSDGGASGSNVAWGAGLHLFTPLPFRPGQGGFGDMFRLHFFGNLGQCKDVNFSDNFSDGVASLFDGYRLSFGLGLALRLGQMARVEFNYVIPQITQDGDVPHQGFQFGVGLQFL